MVRLGDLPVVGDVRPQQAALGVLVVPGEADVLAAASSVSVSYRALTAVSAGLFGVGAAGRGRRPSGRVTAAVAPTVFRKSRRLSPASPAGSQSGHTVGFKLMDLSLVKTSGNHPGPKGGRASAVKGTSRARAGPANSLPLTKVPTVGATAGGPWGRQNRYGRNNRRCRWPGRGLPAPVTPGGSIGTAGRGSRNCPILHFFACVPNLHHLPFKANQLTRVRTASAFRDRQAGKQTLYLPRSSILRTVRELPALPVVIAPRRTDPALIPP